MKVANGGLLLAVGILLLWLVASGRLGNAIAAWHGAVQNKPTVAAGGVVTPGAAPGLAAPPGPTAIFTALPGALRVGSAQPFATAVPPTPGFPGYIG